MTNLTIPPVLLIIFNRADLVARVFERIREQRPSQLFIAADGPRVSKPEDVKRCSQARDVTRIIDWPCEVYRLEQDVNLGCKMGVSTAITWFFEHVEQGIILEDDCLPHPSFFLFCGELLKRYKNSNQIALVSGNNFQKKPCNKSYYFSRHAQIWGWATWRRTWQKYDLEMKGWNGDPDSLRESIRNARVRRFFARRFNAVKFEGRNTWDYQLAYLLFANKFSCINPCQNLVENIGFDERATHACSTVESNNSRRVAVAMEFPLAHPTSIVINEKADRYYETQVRGIPANLFSLLLRSLMKRMQKLFNWISLK